MTALLRVASGRLSRLIRHDFRGGVWTPSCTARHGGRSVGVLAEKVQSGWRMHGIALGGVVAVVLAAEPLPAGVSGGGRVGGAVVAVMAALWSPKRRNRGGCRSGLVVMNVTGVVAKRVGPSRTLRMREKWAQRMSRVGGGLAD